MGIGPFSTYAPPGVYTQTVITPPAGQTLTGVRVPVYIGTGNETLSQTDFEMVRGSSSQADTPIFGEDTSNRWVLSGPNNNPTLGPTDGNKFKFRVRNYPIVDGSGAGRVTYDSSKVSVSVNGSPAAVSAVDGPNGIVTLLVPPAADDFVSVNYYFHRNDTRITDDVSEQVTGTSAALIAPKAENYNITSSTNTLLVYVNDAPTPSTILLATGSSRTAADVANNINTAAVTGLTANVVADNQGLSHVVLYADNNISISSGNANAALGFTVGDYTNRNKNFYVFNGPIVDGTGGGVTTTDPSKVVVKVNGAQVLAKSVDGSNRVVGLPTAPAAGAVVTIEYWFNSWQDTFDYLPNSNVTEVGNVGVGPGRRDYINGLDFVVVNNLDQSKIQWGTAYSVSGGVKTGAVPFDSTQIAGLLIDDKMFGVELERFVDSGTASVSTTKFTLPLTPTVGNGRDTPLNISVFNAITNGRMDLPTYNPSLVTAYVGKTWRDAYARGPVVVTEVDGAANVITVRDPVPADYTVFASFWYNRIVDDTYTFNVVTPGPTGVGQYTVESTLTGQLLHSVKFGTKTALPETVQWPSGVETYPDAFIYGGNPVNETVTVTFDTALQPARNASITNANSGPYDIYSASNQFGGIKVDGNAAFSVDLGVGFKAVLMGNPIDSAISFDATDSIQLNIDGVSILVNLASCSSLSDVANAINSELDLNTTVHADGSPDFLSTAPNSNASVVTYGSKVMLRVESSNINSTAATYYISSVKVEVPVGTGITDATEKVGLSLNAEAVGSYSGENQPAVMFGTQDAPYSFTSGLNNKLILNVDGLDFQTNLPTGSSVALAQVVDAINDAYLPLASSTNQGLVLADVITLANNLANAYQLVGNHISDTDFHKNADIVNFITAATPSVDLTSAANLLNDLKSIFNSHIQDATTVHQLADTTNLVTAANAFDLQSAAILAHDIQFKFNAHLVQKGVHGHDDLTNDVAGGTLPTYSITAVADSAGEFQITANGHGMVGPGDYVNITGADLPAINGNWAVIVVDPDNFTLTGSVYAAGWTAGGDVITSPDAFTLADTQAAAYEAHRTQAGVHVNDDDNHVITAAAATTLADAIALAIDVKAQYNAHRNGNNLAGDQVHVVNDTTNIVNATDPTSGATPAGFGELVTLLKNIAYNALGKYNNHLLQTQGVFHVHGTNDTVNNVSATTTALVAKAGSELYADQLVLFSGVNTPGSRVIVRPLSTAATKLGLTAGASASRSQPTAGRLAAALNADSNFKTLAVAWPITVAGLGTYLRIDSLTSGIFSTLAFTSSVTNTSFIPDTNVGIEPGVTADGGENAVAGFTVASSTPGGSNGTGVVGQTYTNDTTGLRFTILPASAGDYSNGGSFTLVVSQTVTCDSSVPVRVVPGVEVSVFNTVNTNPGTTALLKTFKRTGNEPKVGDVYYVSYNYAKTSFDTQLFQDLKKIQQSFGPPNPDYPLSLAARLAILNGAALVGLKQVLKDPNTGVATSGSFIDAIDELKKPISGTVKPDIIVPLGTDPNIFAYLNQHCVFMSAPRQEGERMGVVGTAIGTTPVGVQAIARGLASELMMVVYPDSFIISIQDDSGNLADRLVDGSYVAAALAGSMCSPAVDVATPITRRQIAGFKSIGRVLDPTVANQVAVAGVTVIEQIDSGLRVRHGLTTRTDNVITRTPSVTLTIQYVQQTMRSVLDPFIGVKFTGVIPKQVEQAMAGAFQRLINAQIVNKVSGIVATVDENDPTILRTEAIYVPVFPLEYIVSTMSVRIRL